MRQKVQNVEDLVQGGATAPGRLWKTGALVVAVALTLAAPASAITCTTWNRLSPDQKPQMIEDLIQDAVNGSGGRSYNINRPAAGRCMQRSARRIEDEFDDACFEPRSARMEVLNNIFKKYIWSCVG